MKNIKKWSKHWIRVTNQRKLKSFIPYTYTQKNLWCLGVSCFLGLNFAVLVNIHKEDIFELLQGKKLCQWNESIKTLWTRLGLTWFNSTNHAINKTTMIIQVMKNLKQGWIFGDLFVRIGDGNKKLHESLKCIEYNGIHKYMPWWVFIMNMVNAWQPNSKPMIAIPNKEHAL
jgi:hypothetical protein